MPYCGGMHEHAQPGHNVAGCNEQEHGALGIIVGQRSFVPNWGYDIFEYKEAWGVNELLVPE